jgi:chromosome condensin MukBEF ATPase and DNA-binding subunit MukB
MLRHWQLLGLHALLAALLATAPALADTDTQKDNGDTLKSIDSQLKQLNQTLAALNDIKKELADFRRDTNVTVQKSREDIAELQRKTANLEREVEELRNRLSASTRIALAPPPTTMGRVRLLNTFNAPMTIVVNDRAYRLDPNREQTIDVPVGVFTYEVLGVQPPVTRTLDANKIFTIFVYPRY